MARPDAGPPLIIWTIPDRRFVGLARIDPTAPPQRFATVSEPIDGGSSILETWGAADGGPLANRRTTAWSSELRVQAIGGTGAITAVGGVAPAGLRLEFVNPANNFSAPSSVLLESAATGMPRVSRIRGLFATTTSPIVVLTDRTERHIARVRRFDTVFTSFGMQLFSTAMTGDAFGDDLVELPAQSSTTGRLLVTGRADGQPSYASLTGLSYGPITPRVAWSTFPLTSTGVNASPPGQFVDLVTSGAPTFTGPVRAASDGNLFLWLGGQLTGGALRLERRALGDLGLQPPLDSTGPMVLVDLIRGPQGVFVLAWVDRAVSFAGQAIPYTPGTGSNVVVIAMLPLGTQVLTWNLPGDQRPVAFEHADGTLAILVNEGPMASFWRTPTP
ncbi:MAG: hypothetical protein SFW67_08785 [Myxococcaceae bacterium]|nr:hypothetical protein [Myxococcaceae bacterium]